MTKITSISIQGIKKWNEDAVVVNQQASVYGVFDGATQVLPDPTPQGTTGGFEAAQTFASHLQSLQEIHSLRDVLVLANVSLAGKMRDSGVDVSLVEQLWSTCVACIRLIDDGAVEQAVEYAQLGDSMIMAMFHNGTFELLTEDTVDGVSARVKALPEAERTLLMAGLDRYDECYRQPLLNRRMANREGGYTVANGTVSAMERMTCGRLARANVHALVMLTDGLFYPGEKGRADWNQTHELLLSLGPCGYVTAVQEREKALGLTPDDKSLVMVQFEDR